MMSWHLLNHSGWCSRCRWGSRWQMVTVRTGMASYAGLCTEPRQSLQDKVVT